MPILNYTTQIDVHHTLGAIQQALAKAGARRIAISYDEQGIPEAVMFEIRIQGRNAVPSAATFRLPSNHTGVLARLMEDPAVPRKLRSEAQARRVAWRITKDWVEAQLAIIDAQLAEPAEVFLPYLLTPSGQTLYQEFTQGYLLSDTNKENN